MDYLYQLVKLIKRWSSYIGLTDNQNFEDLFYQLLHDKNYDEALSLAQKYKYLDIDLVYKCKWRNSGITVQSINLVLSKIQDKLWTINECVQTVPISYEACRTLIEFGLKEASLRLLYELGNESTQHNLDIDGGKHGFGKITKSGYKSHEKQPLLSDDASDDKVEGLIDFDHLNDQQKELLRCRQDLLRHEHALFAYESVLGDYRTVQQHFDHVFYDEFRQKCPLNACIDYARDGDAHAVEIMMNFYTHDLTPHLLAILSNFPETLSPYQYRNLLPCLREDDNVYEWRTLSGQIVKDDESEWSCRHVHGVGSTALSVGLKNTGEVYEKEFYNNKDNEFLQKYKKLLHEPYTAEELTEWFRERALEIESRTLLLSYAIQLLHLGIELNIKNLQKTRDDLTEFDQIVYDCCTENNIYLSYKEFNSMSQLDRLILMTGDSLKSCTDRFRFYVIPYLNRREETKQLNFKDKAELLREYFIKLAHTREHLCKPIYNDLIEKISCDNFIANWTRDLDDVLDGIGEEIDNIERDRQAKQLSTMASQTLALGDLKACFETCEMIMKKNYKECWALCCNLGMHKQFKDVAAKYKLLAFALTYCDDSDGKTTTKMLDYIIELRKRDEKLQLAYLKLNM